jgi:hypothetical protein
MEDISSDSRRLSEEIFPGKERLVNFVEEANEGKFCLPNFQRDFVWTRDEVAELLRSILRRYYIGSLLLLPCDSHNAPFSPVFFRGAKPLYNEPQPEGLVLDGQQRITSLLYALTAPPLNLKDSSQPRRFFLDLIALLEDPNDDEIIFDRSPRELDGLDKAEVQFERMIIPCTELFSLEHSSTWVRSLRKWLRKNRPDEVEDFENSKEDRLTRVFTNFASFDVPLVKLKKVSDSDTEAIGRVCAIFEKLNSTGVELSVYDLLTARLYRSGIRLHTLWDQACKDNKRLAEWSKKKADTNKFGVLVLRTLALLRGLDPKPRILINLKPEDFEQDWRRAAGAIERALELIMLVGPDGFGVFNRKWLPGFGLIPILAALRAEIEERKLGEGPRSDLRRWYWSNVFLERYSSAVESKSRKDYSEMLGHWVDGKGEPSIFSEAKARIGAEGYTVRESASYASALYSGVFCLLAVRGARDWRRGEAILLQELQDHHVFPRAYLRSHNVTKQSEANSIVNRTLISDETNNRIKDKAPADYIGDAEIFPSGATESLLKPHFISQASIEGLKKATEGLSNDGLAVMYDEFLKAREATIVDEIRSVCGVSTKASQAESVQSVQ